MMTMNEKMMNDEMLDNVAGGSWTDKAWDYFTRMGYDTATKEEEYLWYKYYDEVQARADMKEEFDLDFMKAMLKRGYLKY